MADGADGGIDATLAAWRACGADAADPVRFRFIEALARRAAGHGGPVRGLLDARLAALLAAYREALGERAADTAAEPAVPERGPLADLVEHIRRSAGLGDEPLPASAPELKTLQAFRSTWSRLSAQQRLTQSLAHVPENAGPLNSHHLVHRSLSLMRDLSPAYLDRFMSYVDALLWLDDANGAAVPAAKAMPRGKPASGGRPIGLKPRS